MALFASKSQVRLTQPLPALFRYGSYPAVLVTSYVLLLALWQEGVPTMPATLLTALVASLVITAHERLRPYRSAWRPGKRELARDAAFMVSVQVVLPELFSFAAVGLASLILGRAHWAVSSLWPHEWDIASQALLLFVIVDFLRYWVHRAAHRYAILWRFHAVHHAPERLHWLNVGNFHPCEKFVQFAVESAPFLLLGVGLEVFALRFVFYAVNGFYKHANCDIRLGWLNRIVNGPEFHRWHHSRRHGESNCNFGGDLILWDALFHTRFLPDDREVGPLGLEDPCYPSGFWGQITAPFIGFGRYRGQEAQHEYDH